MKKFFLFAAALVAAMTVNSASFTGFDFRDGTLGTQISEGLLDGGTNLKLTQPDAAKLQYEIRNVAAGVVSFELGGIEFSYSDQSANKVAFKTYGTYVQPNGPRRLVTIPTVPGEKVRVYVASALEGVGVVGAEEGATVDLVAWGDDKDQYVVLTATDYEMIIRSDDGEDTSTKLVWKIGAILPDEGTTGLEEVFSATKAVKVVKDGQVVIKRDGRFFNVLGAEVK